MAAKDHASAILADEEERRALQARGHGLPHVHGARDHHAHHRRDDVGVGEVHLRRFEGRPLVDDHRLVQADLGEGLVVDAPIILDGVLRDGVLGEQLRVALEGELRVGEGGLVLLELRECGAELRIVLRDDQLERNRIDGRADLPDDGSTTS